MTAPLLLIRYRSGENVSDKNQSASDDQREEPIQASCLHAGGASGAGTIKGKRAKMLRGEVPGHPCIVNNDQADEPFRARPGQRLIRWEKERKTSDGDQDRKHH